MNDKTLLLKNLHIDRDETGDDLGAGAGRWWLFGVGFAMAMALVVWLMGHSADAVAVRTATAQLATSQEAKADNASILDASGYVVARRQTTVAAKITGKVARVLIEEGEYIEQGQILAVLDDSNLRAQLEQAGAEVEQAKAVLAAADVAAANEQTLFERSKILVANKFIARADFDKSKADFDAAQNRVLIAKQSLKVALASFVVAQRNAEDATIRAPFSGVVTVKAAQPGEIISPLSAGGGFTRTGIGTIVDMDSLEVDVDISENHIDRIRAGQPATVTLNAYPEWQIPAEVIATIPTADRSKATVKVRVAFRERDARIIPEMGVRVSFLNRVARDNRGTESMKAVVIPPDAIQDAGNSGVVFVVHDRTVERRAVQLGAKTATGRIVTAGLPAGTTVAIGDFSRLSDGAAIKVLE